MPLQPSVSDEELKQSIADDMYPHYHQCGDLVLPRVSSVLKTSRQSLHYKLNFMDCDQEFLDRVEKTTLEGIVIHEEIQRYLTGYRIRYENLTVTEHQKMRRFVDWTNNSTAQLLTRPDSTFFSERLGFAGSLDILCRVKKRNCIYDVKTGGDEFETNWLQVNAYAELAEELLDIRVDEIGILLLGRKNAGSYTLLTRRPTQTMRDSFHRRLDQWYAFFPEPFGEVHEISDPVPYPVSVSVVTPAA